ncbi:MAG: tetratricopeptide repeat protein [Opitutales bacterium]|nr:tetratricopeptide repeat protein [Opitutales bacterium]
MIRENTARDSVQAVEALLEEVESRRSEDLPGALNRATEALRLAELAGDEALVDNVLGVRAQVYSMLKRGDEALADAERALAGHKRRGNQRGRASALNTLAIIKEHKGAYAESYLLQAECLEILRPLDLPHAVAQVASNLGLTCTYIGDWDQALVYYEESLAAWEDLPEQEGKGHLLVNLGFALQDTGDIAEAEERYREALAIYRRHSPERYRITPLCNLGSSALERGDTSAAEEIARELLPLSERQQDPARKAHALGFHGALLKAQGRTDEAREAHKRAARIYEEIGMQRGVATSLRHLALVESNNPSEARRLFHQALEVSVESGLKPLSVEILGDLYRLARQTNRWEDACRFLEEKLTVEKALVNERTSLKLKALHLESELQQSRRETELERNRAAELAGAMAKLKAQKHLAEEENRQKSEILNFAAHDLRNLVWGILGPAELLRQDRAACEGQPHSTELVDAVLQSAQVLDETLGQVLDAAAIESGSIRLKREPLPLMPLAETVHSLWQLRAEAKGQNIVLVPGVAGVAAKVDRQRILDCMGNLVSNAIKYSPADSVIRIGWEVIDGEAAFFVADEGPGLTEADKELMGRLFQRLSARPTGDEITVGVGLAVVKRIIALHDGRLEVKCPPQGGSVFRIIVPLRSPEGSNAPETAAELRPAQM